MTQIMKKTDWIWFLESEWEACLQLCRHERHSCALFDVFIEVIGNDHCRPKPVNGISY